MNEKSMFVPGVELSSGLAMAGVLQGELFLWKQLSSQLIYINIYFI